MFHDRPDLTEVDGIGVAVEVLLAAPEWLRRSGILHYNLACYEARLGDAHTLRVGGDVASSAFALTGSQTNPAGAYVVVNEGNIPARGNRYAYADIPPDVRVLSYTIDAAQKQVDLTQTLYGAFVEDRWRPSPSLTVPRSLRSASTASAISTAPASIASIACRTVASSAIRPCFISSETTAGTPPAR